ncbi:hypothetical protein NPIL_635151 [Nephila pilipes]|uniref:15-hydroxyprostaglandin dehydrogenase [NAD(+)] n=1 Tax=Nephila pilipes TaxID=299642 RepID=A0A8X6Q7N5_NEPPI|nr:hypothetical protein NPIL_635151 [Nephila pilipes]
MNFKGKVALVTGGAQGIGKAFCTALLSKGMKVCICDINQEAATEYIEMLPDTEKDNVIFEKCDVTQFSEFRDTFKQVISTFGRIDLVVNNAGLVDEHDWKKMIDINFIGVINGIQLAFHYMDVNLGGHGGFVINTGSNSGFEPFPLAPVYAGCKHAINGLTKSYGTNFHFRRTGIKVNAICPGPTDTSLFHTFPDMCIDKEYAEKHNKAVKYIKPEEVANALIRLLEENRNGALLRVDQDGIRYE